MVVGPFLSHLTSPLHPVYTASESQALLGGMLQQFRALRSVQSLYTFEVVVVLQPYPEQRHSHPLTHCTAEEFHLPDGLQSEESPQTKSNLWFPLIPATNHTNWHLSARNG